MATLLPEDKIARCSLYDPGQCGKSSNPSNQRSLSLYNQANNDHLQIMHASQYSYYNVLFNKWRHSNISSMIFWLTKRKKQALYRQKVTDIMSQWIFIVGSTVFVITWCSTSNLEGRTLFEYPRCRMHHLRRKEKEIEHIAPQVKHSK